MDPLNISYSDKLDSELKLLGFQNGQEIFANAKPFGPFLISRTTVPVKAWTLGYDRAEFFFMLALPDNHCPDFVRAVRATTGREQGYRNEEDKTTMWYSYLIGSIPTKSEILEKIESLERNRIKHAAPVVAHLLVNRKERQKKTFHTKGNRAPPF